MQNNRPQLFNPSKLNSILKFKYIDFNFRKSLNRDVRKKELLKITIEN